MVGTNLIICRIRLGSLVHSIRRRAHKTSLTRQCLGPLICLISLKECHSLEPLGSFLRLQDLPMPRYRISRLPRLPCPSLQLLSSQLRQLNLLHNLVVRATPLTGTFRRQVMIEVNSRFQSSLLIPLTQNFPSKTST